MAEGTPLPGPQTDPNDTVGEQVDYLIKNAPTVIDESKKGYKTTEFWVSLLASVLVVFDGIPTPETKEGYVVGAIAVAYAVARGIAKAGVPAVRRK
jgi:hypothetical protein